MFLVKLLKRIPFSVKRNSKSNKSICAKLYLWSSDRNDICFNFNRRDFYFLGIKYFYPVGNNNWNFKFNLTSE
jgi:hypothetical protein